MLMRKGIWSAIGAYVLWGVFPLYWKLLDHIPAVQIIGYRVLFSFASLVLYLSILRKWKDLRRSIGSVRTVLIHVITGLLLGTNWMIYIWGVTNGHIVDTSLGYFINPLISVLFGVIFLQERLRFGQWIPIVMVAAAIVYLTVTYGALPWIGLSLAGTFAVYGLIKKTARLGALFGLTLETAVMSIPCTAYLVFLHANGLGTFGQIGLGTDLLLIGAGTVTILPLLMFAVAARSIPLWLVGLLQYIAPTMQFLIGVLVFSEPFTMDRAVGFMVIWIALVIFWVEGVITRRRQAAPGVVA